jgi:lysyl-tRNA synthetase class 2
VISINRGEKIMEVKSEVMPFVESSMMSRVEYDEDTSELDITFKSGKTYRYREVPPDVYSDLLDAESKGEFFNENIKDTFDFVEVVPSRRR